MNEKKIMKGLRKRDWTCGRSREWSSLSPLYNTSSVMLRKIQWWKESKQAKKAWLKQRISKHTSIHYCFLLSIPICWPSGREFQTENSKAAASLKASGATSPGRLRPIRHVLVLDKEREHRTTWDLHKSQSVSYLEILLVCSRLARMYFWIIVSNDPLGFTFWAESKMRK